MTARARLRNTRHHQPYRRPHYDMLHLVALGWMYVVLMVAVVEALSAQGTLLGAFFTVVGWGLLPLGVVLYILGTPARRRARQAAESAALPAGPDPDGGSHAPGDAVAPERKEP
jgi:predicted membrane channel-forming protein YqfA (hemolysin III family)